MESDSEWLIIDYVQAKCSQYIAKVCQWLVAGRWFSPGTPVSSTNKTDHHDITEKNVESGIKHHNPYPNPRRGLSWGIQCHIDSPSSTISHMLILFWTGIMFTC
jgi:hypothetical protein